MLRSVGSLDDFEGEELNQEPPTKKRKLNVSSKCGWNNDSFEKDIVVSQKEKNDFFLAIAKCDVRSFDAMLSKLDNIGISRTAIKEWQFWKPELIDGTFTNNNEEWKEYTQIDITLMLWISNYIFSTREHTHTLVLYNHMNCMAYNLQTKEMFKRLNFRSLWYIVDTLQRDCDCRLISEPYYNMKFVDLNIKDESYFFHILNVDGIEIEDIGLAKYRWRDCTNLVLAYNEWNVNWKWAFNFACPLIANGAKIWSITEVFQSIYNYI